MIKKLFTIFFSLFCLAAFSQKGMPARPEPPRLVNDFTGILTADQRQALESKLVAFDDSTSIQIAVVLIESLDGRDIAEYGVDLGRAWGIGNKENNNGVLLLVSKGDRKIHIATGYGVEGALPDITASHIIDEQIKPNFRDNDFYRGLDEGTDAIIAATKGEYKAPENYRKKKGKREVPGVLVLLIIFVIMYFIRRGGGGGGYYGGGGYRRSHGPGGIWFFPTSGGGSWGGGSSSGGFGGFGGGSFGGGGASGDW
jgi:uncharacterized protein